MMKVELNSQLRAGACRSSGFFYARASLAVVALT